MEGVVERKSLGCGLVEGFVYQVAQKNGGFLGKVAVLAEF